jgi:serine phosphatase RsbU (regulator of sigma subunit)
MKKLLSLLVLLISINCFAQNKQLDSLKLALKNCKEDTNKINTLNRLGKQLYILNIYDTSESYAKQALELSEKIKFIKGQATAYNILGNIYVDQANYPEALKYHQASLDIRLKLGDKKGIGASYNNIGLIFQRRGNFPEALKSYLKALQIKEEIKDVTGCAVTYNNIGTVYKEQGNYTESYKNHLSALKLFEKLDNQQGVAESYMSIGNMFYDKDNYIDALINHKKALDILLQTEDKWSIAACYNNLGLIYQSQNNYKEALQNYLISLKLKEELDDSYDIATSKNNIGYIYLKQNKVQEAKNWFSNALITGKQMGSKAQIKESYNGLALADSALGNYKEALNDYKQFTIYKDSLFNEENTKKTVQTQMQYEFDKKEINTKAEQDKKDAVTVAEKRKQQLIITIVSMGLLLVLGLAGVILRSLRINQKKNKIITEQKELVEKQKQVVEEQKHLVEEKHKEITDSINYAERIQRSFIATKEILNENLNDYFVLFKPKDVVSGDFYWASKLNNGNFALATADSTGHGVPGAIMSLLNVTSLEKAIEIHTQPADILNATRKIIIERLKKDGSAEGGKDGMDASLTVYDFKNNKLIIAAANNPVWIVRASVGSAIQEVIEIKADKMPIGKHDKDTISFTQQEIDLQKGDVVYTLTDGFPDQFGGEKGKKFMSKNLRELLVVNAHLPMNLQKQLLEKAFSDWVGDLEQVDDVTLIGVRV